MEERIKGLLLRERPLRYNRRVCSEEVEKRRCEPHDQSHPFSSQLVRVQRPWNGGKEASTMYFLFLDKKGLHYVSTI